MPRSLHSRRKGESTARSITAPSMFAGFPAELQDELKLLTVSRKFSDGQILQQRGDETNGFYLVEKGQIKLGRFGSDGSFNVTILMGPGDSYGELAVIGEFPRVMDVVAVGDVELKWISGEEMDRVLANRPDVARDLMKVMAKQLQEALDAIVVQRKLNTTQRLARNIAAMCKGREMPLELAINQADFAELLGASRMTVAKILKQLESEGLVKRHYASLTVYNAGKLRNY